MDIQGEYVLNINEADDLIVYVECTDIDGKKFDSIVVSLENEDDQCLLLQRIFKGFNCFLNFYDIICICIIYCKST